MKVETRAPGAFLWVQLGPQPTPPSLVVPLYHLLCGAGGPAAGPSIPVSPRPQLSQAPSLPPMHTDLNGDCSPGCRPVECSGGRCAARLGRSQLSSGRRGSVSRRPVQDTAGPATLPEISSRLGAVHAEFVGRLPHTLAPEMPLLWSLWHRDPIPAPSA